MSLYLKYRPKDFKNLVGQQFVKNTLQKAISDDKTIGAYLFCGPRGTGKTSTARIFSKALNCENITDGNPCNTCVVCEQINQEKLIDIIEIDAASHTGVDNIREIIGKARFTPTRAKYKVYIIDEVHMLSKGAFNALLKILEEPEKHVKFILATTETHKVPKTIISRCQRYDFKNISEKDIKDRLNFIAEQEKVKIDEESLDYITKNAFGGLRDAISLFEQVIIDNKIEFKDIIKNLGIVETKLLENFLEDLLNKDNNIVKNFDELIEDGKNIKLFFKELIFFIKQKIINMLNEDKNISEILNILDQLNKTYSETKNTLDENTTFLIGLLKIVNNESKDSILKGKIVASSLPRGETERGLSEIEIKSTIENKKPETISSIEEINDIFGNKIQTPKNDDGFDKENFLKQLKAYGAQPGLTMSIRGADIEVNSTSLNIKFKTNFALKGSNNPENMDIISKTLESIGLESLKISLS